MHRNINRKALKEASTIWLGAYGMKFLKNESSGKCVKSSDLIQLGPVASSCYASHTSITEFMLTRVMMACCRDEVPYVGWSTQSSC
jgi:hypothetical protein